MSVPGDGGDGIGGELGLVRDEARRLAGHKGGGDTGKQGEPEPKHYGHATYMLARPRRAEYA